MTINYTTLLGLAKPVTGTESGTWGDVVNDQITSLVEDAIANAASLNVTSGNVTLTDNNGSSDQARMAILLVTGTPGVSRNIVAPSTSKWYIVKNGSNAEVVLKGSATTGVTIPAGVEALAFWNGSDFELVSMVGPSSSTDNAITRYDGTTGKVVQNSGVTIDDSNNMTGVVALTTTGVVTVPAGTNSAPAITTTGDTNTGIFFPAADTIAFTEGGTESMRIDASGNLGIGATPSAWSGAVPRALQFGSNAAVNAGAALYLTCNGFYNGTNWIYQNTDLASYYIQNVGTHQWYTATSGTAGNTISFSERMRLDSSGNLGIGTNSPGARLHVNTTGNPIKTSGPGSGSILADVHITRTSSGTTIASGPNIQLADGTATNDIIIQNSQGRFGIWNNPASTWIERLILDSSGNVGIGTSSPSTYGDLAVYRAKTGVAAISVTQQNAATNDGAKLSTYYQATETASLKYYWDGSQFQGQLYSYGPLAFLNGASPTERMRITSGGDVGIGTSSPGAKLDVNGDVRIGSQLLTGTGVSTGDASIELGNFRTGNGNSYIDFHSAASTDFEARVLRLSGVNGNFEITNSGTGALIFFTGSTPTERARFNSSGNFMVGRTSTLNSGIVDVQSLSGQNCFVAQVQNNGNSNFQGFNTSGTATFFVDGTGQIYAAFTSIASTSDRNQKENIQPIKYGLNEVCALNPVSFDFKEEYNPEGKGLLGFIAQDVQPVLPELVKPFGDSGYLGLKMGDMLPVLVKAIQEQQAIIEQLTQRIAALESKGA